MSAHLCSTADIDLLVDFARGGAPSARRQLPLPPADFGLAIEPSRYGFDAREFPDQLGRALLMANWLSLRARYADRAAEYFGNGEEVSTYRAPRHRRVFGAYPNKRGEEMAVVLKQLDHFDYQACEVSDYADSWAQAVTNQLRRWAIAELPGYKEAPWGL